MKPKPLAVEVQGSLKLVRTSNHKQPKLVYITIIETSDTNVTCATTHVTPLHTLRHYTQLTPHL